MTDNIITDNEFQLIMDEFSQYNVLKDSVRVKLTRHSSRPDVEKIKKDVRSEMEADFRKKISALAAIRVWNVFPIWDPPFQTPHLRPPISGPDLNPPSQAPHLRPPISGPKLATSDPPPQTLHLRPPTSDPPQQTLYLRPHAFRARQQNQAPKM